MNDFNPIQTEYKGYLFRSRLEARWAVFFDALGVKWEYEPEGYDLGDGLLYLPDFLLHGVTVNHAYQQTNRDIYVEVKGRMTDLDAMKIKRFYESGYADPSQWGVSHGAVLLVGSIPNGEDMHEIIDSMQEEAYHDRRSWPNYYNFETVDGDYFAAYPGVDHHGVFTLFGDDSTYISDMDEITTEHAYRRARQARFEFGETPHFRRFSR